MKTDLIEINKKIEKELYQLHGFLSEMKKEQQQQQQHQQEQQQQLQQLQQLQQQQQQQQQKQQQQKQQTPENTVNTSIGIFLAIYCKLNNEVVIENQEKARHPFAVIEQVANGSPAQQAGLQPGGIFLLVVSY